MQRQFLISDTQVRIIQKEVTMMKSYCTSTPDTEAAYKSVMGMLDSVIKGVPK